MSKYLSIFKYANLIKNFVSLANLVIVSLDLAK